MLASTVCGKQQEMAAVSDSRVSNAVSAFMVSITFLQTAAPVIVYFYFVTFCGLFYKCFSTSEYIESKYKVVDKY
jgi:hypothetical protein